MDCLEIQHSDQQSIRPGKGKDVRSFLADSPLASPVCQTENSDVQRLCSSSCVR